MDTNNLPNNSHRVKEESEIRNSKEKIEPVVSNPGKKKKKSGLEKVKGSFVASDGSNIISYLAQDVLIPALKKMFVQAVKNGIDMLVYGEPTGNETKNGKIGYRNRYREVNREEPRYSRSPRRGVLDYENIIFDTRADAEEVLMGMQDIIDRYGFVSVSDMYDLSDVPNENYTLSKYGWANIQSARVIKVRDGYVVDMPKALPFD